MTNRRLAEGCEVSVSEDGCDELSPLQLDRALRLLARMFIRVDIGDPAANVAPHSPSSRLTVAPEPSPHPNDDAA